MPPLLVLNLQLELERLDQRLRRAEAEIAEMKQLAGDRKRTVKAEKPGAKPAARCRQTARDESLRASARLWLAAITLAKLDAADLIREANATRPAGDRLPFRPSKIQRGTYLHILDMDRTGPSYEAIKSRNLKMDFVIQAVEEEIKELESDQTTA